MLQQNIIAARIDQMVCDELDTVAAVPTLLFVAVPFVDIVVCVTNNYIHPLARTVFYDIVTALVYPLGILFTLGTAFCVLWRYIRNTESLSRRRLIPLLLFCALLVLACISTLVNVDNLNRFWGYYPSMVGLYTYVMFVLVYFWTSSHISSEGMRRLICDVLCVVSIPIGIHALWITATYGKVGHIISIKPEGIFYNSNHYGYYLAVVIVLSSVLFVMEKNTSRRVFYLVVFVFNTVVLLLNATFGAYLASIIGLISLIVSCCMVRRSHLKRVIVINVLFYVLLGIVSIWNPLMLNNFTAILFDIKLIVSDESDAGSAGSGRWRLWTATVEYIAQKPLLGWGADGIADALYNTARNPRTHCEPLMYAVFFGIPAALCYVGACISVLVINIKSRLVLDDTALACVLAAGTYFASSLVGNMCFYTAPLFFIMMGMSFSLIDSPRLTESDACLKHDNQKE